MSKKTCYECENSMYPLMCSNTLCPIDNENFAEQCGGFTQIQKLPKTVFHRLTASPEVLAEKLVYGVETIVPLYQYVVTRWYSNIIHGTIFDSKPEAIAATVARLKEVCDE